MPAPCVSNGKVLFSTPFLHGSQHSLQCKRLKCRAHNHLDFFLKLFCIGCSLMLGPCPAVTHYGFLSMRVKRGILQSGQEYSSSYLWVSVLG